jgi:hypothetical protein
MSETIPARQPDEEAAAKVPPPARSQLRAVVVGMWRWFRCLFGHGTVTITRQRGYYQWGVCSCCGKGVERDGHIWSSDNWRTSSRARTP